MIYKKEGRESHDKSSHRELLHSLKESRLKHWRLGAGNRDTELQLSGLPTFILHIPLKKVIILTVLAIPLYKGEGKDKGLPNST